jgi:hypothetical protein
MNYEKDVNIDETALDVEWKDQAPLALKYAKHLSRLNAEVAKLEEEKKTKRSELILKVNKDPMELIGKKTPNAADIEAYYRTDPEYKEIIKDLLEAQEEAEYANLAHKEIALTRKKALENMVILHGQQYFAGPSVPRDFSYEVQQRREQEKVDAGIAGKLKRNRKKKE